MRWSVVWAAREKNFSRSIVCCGEDPFGPTPRGGASASESCRHTSKDLDSPGRHDLGLYCGHDDRFIITDDVWGSIERTPFLIRSLLGILGEICFANDRLRRISSDD